MKRIPTLLTLIISFTAVITAQTNEIPLVYNVENTGSECNAPPLPSANQLTNISKLPDPFEWSDGSGRCETFADWTCRRVEIKAEIENYEIGKKPNRPSDITASYSNGKLTVTIKENGKTVTLTSNVTMPSGSGPFPVIIGMNSATGSLSSSLFNGCIQIPFNHDQVATYSMSGTKSTNAPFYQMYPNLTNVGDYCAWSWGISRLIDGIELVQSQLNADLKHIGVTGCSYAGKMALFAGAFDERIALTIAQESGGGGINSWRVSETIGNVEKLDNTNYSWFMQSFKNNFYGQVNKIPYDHHELIAMIAPRAVLTLGNPDYEWLGDASGYISCMAAMEVWKAMGIEDRIGFDFARGHSHCAAATSQNSAVTKFVDKFLKGKSEVNTTIRDNSLNADYNSWITTWKGHTLTMDIADLSVKIISSTSSQRNYADENLEIEVSATAKNGIEKIEFYLDGVKISEVSEVPYTWTITNPEIGSHIIYAVVTDKSGESVTSAESSFKVEERKVFRMELNSTLIVETEDMPDTDGKYIGEYTENFTGMSYYANNDMTQAAVYLAPENGTFIVKMNGCSDANTAANISLYIDDNKKATYTWNSNTPSIISKEITVTGENPHTVRLLMETDSGQSDAFIDYISFTEKNAPTNIIEEENIEETIFFPNPAKDQIYVNLNVIETKIYNTTGVLVYNSSNQIINLKSLDSGVYFIHLYTKNNLFIKKIIKE